MNVLTIEASLRTAWLKALAGDPVAYEQVLQRISHLLRGFFKKRLQTSDVEDLIQDTLMAIHQKRHTYHSDQPLTAWVYAIARYKLIDHWRGQSRQENLHDNIDDWADVLSVAEAEHEHGMANHDVAQLLSTLPDKQRIPIEHTKLQGLSLAESAHLTGQSLAYTKVNIHRGLKTLARKLGVSV